MFEFYLYYLLLFSFFFETIDRGLNYLINTKFIKLKDDTYDDTFVDEYKGNSYKNDKYSYEYLMVKIKYISTVISLIHCSLSLYFSYSLFPSHYELNYSNSKSVNIFLLFGVAYFVRDMAVSYALQEYHFILHHVLTLIPSLLSLSINQYGNYIVLGMFYGEITNPIQQLCFTLNLHQYDYSQFTKVGLNINNIFFIINRTFIAPYIHIKTMYYIDSYLITFLFCILFILLYIMSLIWSIKLIIKYLL